MTRLFRLSLTQLTFATCVSVGLLWTKTFTRSSQSYDDIEKPDSVVDSIAFKALSSVFYAYLAIGVNNKFEEYKLVNTNVLYWGYATVLTAVGYELIEKNTREYRMRWYNSKK